MICPHIPLPTLIRCCTTALREPTGLHALLRAFRSVLRHCCDYGSRPHILTFNTYRVTPRCSVDDKIACCRCPPAVYAYTPAFLYPLTPAVCCLICCLAFPDRTAFMPAVLGTLAPMPHTTITTYCPPVTTSGYSAHANVPTFASVPAHLRTPCPAFHRWFRLACDRPGGFHRRRLHPGLLPYEPTLPFPHPWRQPAMTACLPCLAPFALPSNPTRLTLFDQRNMPYSIERCGLRYSGRLPSAVLV